MNLEFRIQNARFDRLKTLTLTTVKVWALLMGGYDLYFLVIAKLLKLFIFYFHTLITENPLTRRFFSRA